MIRASLLGQNFWAKRIQNTLAMYAPAEVQAQTLILRSFLSARQIGQLKHADVLVRIGYRPGSPSPLGRAFDASWAALRKMLPHVPAIHYWIGTDVLRTAQDLASGRLRKTPFEESLRDWHVADAPWLAEELAGIGISASVQPVPAPNLRALTPPPLPGSFRVLSYVPDYRYRFYGGELIQTAAERLPRVQFDIVGGDGKWLLTNLPNLHFHGWQHDMARFYQNCSLVLRIVEHDAMGVTVKEGLSFARHVIYTYAVPETVQIPFGDKEGLIAAIASFEEWHDHGLLRPNTAGWQYAMREFDEAKDAREFAALLQHISNSAALNAKPAPEPRLQQAGKGESERIGRGFSV
jgi:hypothetical protein